MFLAMAPGSPDDVDDYDAEGQTGQSVHGVVTLQKTGEEGSCGIGRRWRHIGDAVRGVQQGCHHQDGQHHGRHAGCLDDGIDADGDGTEPEQGGQVIFQPAIKPVIDLSLSFVLTVCTFLHGPLQ